MSLLNVPNSKSALLAALTALFADKIKEVKTFRLFNNQFEREDREKAFIYPAVFVEFVNIDYLSKSESRQEGDLGLRFHIGIKSLKTEDPYILELAEIVNFWLQGFGIADLITSLDRKRERQDTDHAGVIVWQTEYRTQITDNSANRKYKLVRMESIDTLEIDRAPSTYFLHGDGYPEEEPEPPTP